MRLAHRPTDDRIQHSSPGSILLHTPVQKLSWGMQQKVAIAVALIHNPKLLLDESTLGLDIKAGCSAGPKPSPSSGGR